MLNCLKLNDKKSRYSWTFYHNQASSADSIGIIKAVDNQLKIKLRLIMEKQTIINTIEAKLSSIGVFPQKGTASDISIQTEFLNAAWGSGNKKIEYHALAFLNEAERTLYFWEYTKESSSGISFGSYSETSFQSGTTLFRKVKSVGYAADGKAYEYSLDLGAITKIFKETAKTQGWKFKVVLKREKASYPPGHMPLTNDN